jgi:hypothetical protein
MPWKTFNQTCIVFCCFSLRDDKKCKATVMFALYLVMKLFSRSALIATVAAAGLFAVAAPASACMFSKSSASQGGTSFDGPAGLLDNAPDGKTLGITLGGFGILASLLSGGVVFYRKQRLARLAEQESAIATEFELSEPVAEDVVVFAEPEVQAEADAEQEVVLTR